MFELTLDILGEDKNRDLFSSLLILLILKIPLVVLIAVYDYMKL